ncbi:MAG: ABC transporter permease [Anaerolineae bacterium]
MSTLKQLVRNPTSLTGLILVLFFIVMALGAPIIAPPAENARDPYMIPHDGFSVEPRPPSEEHPLGTTEGQYDILYGIVWGTRTAFRVGIVITLFTAVTGVIVGSIAAFYGGWVDDLLMRVTEIFMAFPFLLAAITLTAVLQTVYGRGEAGILVWGAKIIALVAFGRLPTKPLDPVSMRLMTAMMALMAFGWMTYARLIRGDILALKERDFVLAARTMGAGDFRILFRHILPNAIYPTLVVASMDIGSYVLSFAGLGFLGLGAQVGYADWGQMISFARNWIPRLAQHWHIVVFPGVTILLFVLAWNLIGDAFRDILDPRLRGARG